MGPNERLTAKNGVGLLRVLDVYQNRGTGLELFGWIACVARTCPQCEVLDLAFCLLPSCFLIAPVASLLSQ